MRRLRSTSRSPISRADFPRVMFCLSKGLARRLDRCWSAAAELIERARMVRKDLGGGMRQAGVLAAAGLIALEEMPKRLAEDHANARLLAERHG